MKTCTVCNVEKEPGCFYKDGKNSKGEVKFRAECKECYRINRLLSRRMKKNESMQTMSKRKKRV